jgi:hypothetical protein
VLILNQETDDDLGYDARWVDWVRQYATFGNDDDSPDLLDATWLALNDAPIGSRGSLQIFSGTYRDSTPTHHVF